MNETTYPTREINHYKDAPCKKTVASDIKVGDYFPTSDYTADAVTAVRVEDGTYYISHEVKSPIKYDKNGKMMFKIKTITRICDADDCFPTCA